MASKVALDWARLGRAVESRRNRLGLTQPEVTARGGPSGVTLRKLENHGVALRGDSVARLEVALSWPPGHAMQILEGGPMDAPLPPDPTEDPDRMVIGFTRGTLAGRTPLEIEQAHLAARKAVLDELARMDAEQTGNPSQGRSPRRKS